MQRSRSWVFGLVALAAILALGPVPVTTLHAHLAAPAAAMSRGPATLVPSLSVGGLTAALSSSVTPLAVISPPDVQSSTDSMPSQSHGTGHHHGGGNGPVSASLPTGKVGYVAARGWQGISGANSSCLQPLIGPNSSPLACLPPDVSASASPEYVVENVNAHGSIWTTSGQLLRTYSLTDFYTAPSGAGCYLSDPQVFFDNATQRWFSSILSVTCGVLNTQQPNVASQIYLAVSASSDPTGSWYEYALPNPLTGNLSDQPFLGVSSHVVVLSTNQFPDQALALNGYYTGAYFWVIDKLGLEQTACPNPGGLLCSVNYQTYGPFPTLASIHPAHSYGYAPSEFLASALAFSAGQNGTTTLSWFVVNGTPPSTSVTWSNLTIQRTTGPPLGNQPGAPGTLNTDDSRITSGVYQANVSWWAANDGCVVSGESGLHSCLRLIEVTTTGYAFSVAADFDFNGGQGQDDFYPGLTLDPAGDLGVTYAFSSPSVYPSMAVTGRAAGAHGSLEPPTTIVAGTDTEQGGRYGDFCDASPSYANPGSVWVACEYIQNYSQFVWNTWVAGLTFGSSKLSTASAPAVPGAASGSLALAVPGTVAAAATALLLVPALVRPHPPPRRRVPSDTSSAGSWTKTSPSPPAPPTGREPD